MLRKRLKSVLMYGYAGSLAGSLIIDNYYEELSELYHRRYIEEIEKLHKDSLELKKLDMNLDDTKVYDIAKGGVLTSLYAISRKLKCGIGLRMRAVPILQSTVEICEHFRLNPYNILSSGYLITTEDIQATKDILSANGIEAAHIACLYADNVRLVEDRYEEAEAEFSYIHKPDKDEIYKLDKIDAEIIDSYKDIRDKFEF